jgi:hypothetical protein
MDILNLVVMILLGLLGIAGWLRARQPTAAGALAQLESVGGWIGLVGIFWGLWMVINFIRYIGVLSAAPLAMTLVIVGAVAVLGLSIILSANTLQQLLGRNGFTNKLAEIATQLNAFKLILGVVCLAVAAISLVY